MVSPGGDKATAIVIDDDELVRFVLCSALEANGYHTTQAAAFTEVQPQVALARLVVLDANIPEEPLGASLAAIRSENHDAGIVVISGAPVQTDVLTLAGAVFLLKPFSVDDLLSAAAKVASQ